MTMLPALYREDGVSYGAILDRQNFDTENMKPHPDRRRTQGFTTFLGATYPLVLLTSRLFPACWEVSEQTVSTFLQDTATRLINTLLPNKKSRKSGFFC